jgi:hypothetical protein
MTSRERIIDLVSQISAARTQLQQLEAELDHLLPREGAGQRKPAKAKRARRDHLALQIIDLLESSPKAAFAVPDVAKRLAVSSLPSLRKTVLRLAAQRKIRRRRRGLYGAATRCAATKWRDSKPVTRPRRQLCPAG